MPGAARRFFSRRSEGTPAGALTAFLRNAPNIEPGIEIDPKSEYDPYTEGRASPQGPRPARPGRMRWKKWDDWREPPKEAKTLWCQNPQIGGCFKDFGLRCLALETWEPATWCLP